MNGWLFWACGTWHQCRIASMRFPLSAPHFHTTLTNPCRSMYAGWLRYPAVTESGEHFALSQKAREVIPGALEALVVNRGHPHPYLDWYVSEKQELILFQTNFQKVQRLAVPNFRTCSLLISQLKLFSCVFEHKTHECFSLLEACETA